MAATSLGIGPYRESNNQTQEEEEASGGWRRHRECQEIERPLASNGITVKTAASGQARRTSNRIRILVLPLRPGLCLLKMRVRGLTRVLSGERAPVRAVSWRNRALCYRWAHTRSPVQQVRCLAQAMRSGSTTRESQGHRAPRRLWREPFCIGSCEAKLFKLTTGRS